MNKFKEFWYKLTYMIKRNPFLGLLLLLLVVRVARMGIGNIFTWIYNKAMILPGIVIGITFHEAAHGYVSYWLGDPTPRNDGRLTLNPLAHFDVWGFIFLLFAGFGWGKPVRIDSRYYKKPRRDELLVDLAGVFMNFIVAVVFALIGRLMLHTMSQSFYNGIGSILFEIVINIVAINCMLMIFNLIPVPPLDGWGIATELFHLKKYSWWYKIYRYGSLILMLLIIFNITDWIITPIYSTIMNWLLF